MAEWQDGSEGEKKGEMPPCAAAAAWGRWWELLTPTDFHSAPHRLLECCLPTQPPPGAWPWSLIQVLALPTPSCHALSSPIQKALIVVGRASWAALALVLPLPLPHRR